MGGGFAVQLRVSEQTPGRSTEKISFRLMDLRPFWGCAWFLDISYVLRSGFLGAQPSKNDVFLGATFPHRPAEK